MIASVLISRPIHASNQCELINVIVVPNPKPSKKIDII